MIQKRRLEILNVNRGNGDKVHKYDLKFRRMIYTCGVRFSRRFRWGEL